MSEHSINHERDQPTLRPRIWVTSLADYTAGRLHGEWLDAAVTHDELHDAVQRILATSPEPGAEDWAIFDYDDFGNFRVGEHDRLQVVARVARGIARLGPAFAAWAELHDAEPAMLNSFEDAYLGEYDTPSDWAREVLADGVEPTLDRALPEPLRRYVRVDYAAYAHDAHLDGAIHVEPTPTGRVWIFHIL
jgi:antirestriction protein